MREPLTLAELRNGIRRCVRCGEKVDALSLWQLAIVDLFVRGICEECFEELRKEQKQETKK